MINPKNFSKTYQIVDDAKRAKAFNDAGIEAMDNGDFSIAIDLMLEAKNCVEPDAPQYLIAISNIGKLYTVLERLDIACSYCEEVEYHFQRHPDDYDLVGRINNLSLLNSLYVKLNRLDEAKEILDRIDVLHPENDEHCNILMTKIQFYAAVGDMKQYRSATNLYFELLPGLLNEPVHIQQANEMCVFFMNIGQREDAKRVLNACHDAVKKLDETGPKIAYMTSKIMYEEMIGDEAARRRDIVKRYEYMKARVSKNLQYSAEHVIIREQLDEMRRKQEKICEENLRLQKVSETDSLTQLPNRKALGEYAEQTLENTIKAESSMAIEMLDIDYFKQLNDRYGHLAGDHALKDVASILQNMVTALEGKAFAARYGGDEFCIIYHGMTQTEVEETANRLRSHIVAAEIPNQDSHISPFLTVSQGIKFVRPSEGTKVLNLMYAADQTLYEVKHNCKSAIRFC